MRRRWIACFALAGLGVWPAVSSAAAPGDFDPSFGSGGRVVTQLGAGSSPTSPHSRLDGLAMQTNGKLVAAGSSTDSAGGDAFMVARLNPDGSFDPSFGSGGKLISQLGAGSSPASDAHAALLQPDGKIVVAGSATDSGGHNEFMVARLNSDGSFDPGFGSGGKVITQIGSGAPAFSAAGAIALQPDGKIVAGGYSSNGSGNEVFTVARLNANGSPDLTFGTAGKAALFPGDVNALALQGDGKIVAAGSATGPGGFDEFAAARLNSDGSPDAGFGFGGKVVTQLGGGSSPSSAVWGLVVQGDGKVVGGGESTDGGSHQQFTVVRLTPNGSFDPSFGSGGKAIRQLGSPNSGGAVSSEAKAMALQPDGRILAAGDATNNADYAQVAVARLNQDGSFDPSFGSGGVVISQLGGGPYPYSQASGLALQNDGKLVTGGDATDSGGHHAFAMARLIADLPPAAIFSAAPDPALVGRGVRFDGSKSSDPDGSISAYGWSFGDGQTGPGPVAVHAYKAPGRYLATLTVRDNYGLTASQTQTVLVVGVTTLPARGLTPTNAVMQGRIDTGGEPLTWQFQFGSSTRYNKATPVQTIPAGRGSVAVSWRLKALSPKTNYHYRLVVVTSLGTLYGSDLTFTTKPVGKLGLLSSRLLVRGNQVLVPIACASRLPCNGTFSITARARVAGTRTLATIDCTKARSTFYRIKAGKKRTVRAGITPACQALLRQSRQHTLKAKLTTRPRTAQLGIIKRVQLILG